MYSRTPENLGTTIKSATPPETITPPHWENPPRIPLISHAPLGYFKRTGGTHMTISEHTTTDDPVLWKLSGAVSGPTLLIIGDPARLQDAVARLQSLPSLVYLRGTLLVAAQAPTEPADAQLHLNGAQADDAYWIILSEAARLGMISGRGIPASFLKAA